MPATAILGLQWGDEGKGKLVDQLCEKHDVCVRFQGGGNAGHTVYPDGRKVVLHHLPTGVLHKQCLNILGPGMVIDPHKLLEEIDELARLGYKLSGRLVLSDRASITTAIHTALDAAREGESNKIGTTKRGIGPTYADRYDRIGVRACDLLDKQSLREALERALAVRGPQLGKAAPKAEELLEPLLKVGARLKPYVQDSALVLAEALEEGKRVLYEGAQGALLDVAYGTYPFVTSSHTMASGITAGVGLQTGVERVIGVTKAYCTRVGEGPFPTELGKADSEVLREKGGEYGATTGRPRRVGHLDLFALRYVCRLSGVTELAVTKLDVLSGMGDLKVGVGYEGYQEPGLPADIRRFAALKPVYKTLPGWSEDISGARKGGDLPKAARAYLRFMEEFAGVRIGIISVGPQREAAFEVKGAPKG